MAGPLFELRGVGREGGGKTLLADVTVGIEEGERVALLGRSGAGKTTLLRLLPRLDDPDRGTIRYDGCLLEEQDPLALRRAVRLLFQEAAAFPGTVAGNLDVAASIAGRSLSPDERAELLARVGLGAELTDQDALRLSGGERQRLALARALVVEPRVLCLDEPTAHLDGAAARGLLAAAGRSRTVVVATHDLTLARGFATRVVLLQGGRVVEQGEGPPFFAAPSTDEGRRFLEEGR